MYLSSSHYERRRLESHVENRTVYAVRSAELNVYETHQHAEKVELVFNSPVLASMLRGKKVMHLQDGSFDFFPGESVILPAGQLMQIDFPEANWENPTQCLALTVSEDEIGKVVNHLNETEPKSDAQAAWKFSDHNFHFTNDVAVNQIIARLIWLFTENHPSKDIFADFMVKELIIRLMQTEARHLLLDHAASMQSHSRLAFVVQFIRENLHQPLTIELLSKKAYMSQTHFFRAFKNELGISPVDFIHSERIKLAKILLANPLKTVSEVCYACGFNNMSYFSKLFKRLTRLSPSEFRQKFQPEFADKHKGY